MPESRIDDLRRERERLRSELHRIDGELKKIAEQKQNDAQKAAAKRTGKLSN